jgi:hypothetical protein
VADIAATTHRAEQLEQLGLSDILVEVAHVQAAAGGRGRGGGGVRSGSGCGGGHCCLVSLFFWVFWFFLGSGKTHNTRAERGQTQQLCWASHALVGGRGDGLRRGHRRRRAQCRTRLHRSLSRVRQHIQSARMSSSNHFSPWSTSAKLASPAHMRAHVRPHSIAVGSHGVRRRIATRVMASAGEQGGAQKKLWCAAPPLLQHLPAATALNTAAP